MIPASLYLAALAVFPAGPAASSELRLNHVQVIGTHNSYHVAPTSALMAAFRGVAAEWQYSHRPLDEQLGQLGVRQFELDVFADPEGGHLSNPVGAGFSTPPHAEEMRAPGFKVLHVQDIDYVSTCPTFVECLAAVRAWSDAHPRHLPVLILIEAKDSAIDDPLNLGFATPVPYSPELFLKLESEIESVFPRERIITPDDVRGRRRTLARAIAKDGWPLLEECRGKVMFALDNPGRPKQLYLEARPKLKKALLFVDSKPGDDYAAFAKRNDPVGAADEIRDLVERGFLVRTRADAGLKEGREGDTARRDVAFATGAHFVSTDFPEVREELSDAYVVALPGGVVARLNPVSAPSEDVDPDELSEDGE